jgi:hypothetical protein
MAKQICQPLARAKSNKKTKIWKQLAAAMRARGEAFKHLPASLQNVDTKTVLAVERESGEAEARAAKALGREPWVVNLASAKLWKSTLSAERDRRAGPDASPQARGRITRELRAEIKAALDGDG